MILTLKIFLVLCLAEIYGFLKFRYKYTGKSCIIKYENLLGDADKELMAAWNLLRIDPVPDCNQYIKLPENR
jgi:hypothetical protein